MKKLRWQFLVVVLALGAIAVLHKVSSRRPLEISCVTIACVMILVGGFFFRLANLLAGQLSLPAYGPF